MQGTYGNNKDPAPAIYDITARLKWESWESVKGMSKVEAQNNFIEFSKEWLN